MENPIKMDDLGVPPFLETPNVASIQRRFFPGSVASWHLRCFGRPEASRWNQGGKIRVP